MGSNGTPGVARAAGLKKARAAVRPAKRRLLVATSVAVGTLVLTACSSETTEQWKRLGLPEGASDRTEAMRSLWIGAWIAALVIGVLTWGLILYASVRFRRRNEDAPRQTRYNLPLEVLYTLAPFAIIGVLFFYTVEHGNKITHMSDHPAHTINVVGQQWQWTFNHGVGDQDTSAIGDDDDFAYGAYVYESGDGNEIPWLWLPVDQTIQFNLHSPDVIHDFGVPSFLMKMDVIPGRVNKMQVTPTVIGEYAGKCYELCGVSHSRMLFNVKVVSQAEYDAHLEELAAAGQTADAPLLGGSFVNDQAGLDDESAASEGSNE